MQADVKIENRKLTEIRPYENNPRNNEQAVGPVAMSIKTFGFLVPIVIDRDGVIVAGHTRYKAAKKLKLDSVPCIVADQLSPELVDAFRLADNKTGEIAEWNEEKLAEELEKLTGIDMTQFGFAPLEAPVVEDNYDFPDIVEPKTKPGDLYRLGRHRLLCGDSTVLQEVQRLMDGREADMLLTDPPYNVDYADIEDSRHRAGLGSSSRKSSEIKNDRMTEDQYISFLTDVFSNARLNIKSGGGLPCMGSAGAWVRRCGARHAGRRAAAQTNAYLDQKYTCVRPF